MFPLFGGQAFGGKRGGVAAPLGALTPSTPRRWPSRTFRREGEGDICVSLFAFAGRPPVGGSDRAAGSKLPPRYRDPPVGRLTAYGVNFGEATPGGGAVAARPANVI